MKDFAVLRFIVRFVCWVEFFQTNYKQWLRMINKGGVNQERDDRGGLEDWNPFFFSTSDER